MQQQNSMYRTDTQTKSLITGKCREYILHFPIMKINSGGAVEIHSSGGKTVRQNNYFHKLLYVLCHEQMSSEILPNFIYFVIMTCLTS